MLSYLENFLVEKKPKLICETGSGCSSVIIADYCLRHDAKFISVESSYKYSKRTKRLLSDFGYGSLIDSIVFSKITQTNDDKFCYSNLPNFAIDFLFIDGPARTEISRCGVIFSLWDKILTDGWILIDDVHHKSEKRNLQKWQEIHGFKLHEIKSIKGRCFAICQKKT